MRCRKKVISNGIKVLNAHTDENPFVIASKQLIDAAEKNQFKQVKEILLQYPSLVFTSTIDGEELIHLAARKGFKETIRVLLKFGAKQMDLTPTGISAFELALQGNHTNLFDMNVEQKEESKEDSFSTLHAISELFMNKINFYKTTDQNRKTSIERIKSLMNTLKDNKDENSGRILLGCIIAAGDDAQEMHVNQFYKAKENPVLRL